MGYVVGARWVPAQQPGSREFAVADPEGNFWSFGTSRGAPLPTGEDA